MTNELVSDNNYEHFESLLDKMTLALIQGEENELTKANAFWTVINLKNLLKVACSDFFGYDNLKEVLLAEPRNEFGKSCTIQLLLTGTTIQDGKRIRTEDDKITQHYAKILDHKLSEDMSNLWLRIENEIKLSPINGT